MSPLYSRLPEIDRPHLRVGADLLRRSLREDRAPHQHGDALREAKHQVHVVVDDQHADVLGQRRHGVEDDVAFGRGYAGGGLVEQQHFRLEPERDRQLDQALTAIGQFGNAVRGVVGELEGIEQRHRLLDHVLARARRPQHAGRRPQPFGDRDVDIVEHREPAEQAVDLEGAGDAALDPVGLRHLGDVEALEQHMSLGRPQQAGQQVDQRGLAGAVGADQGMPRAGLELEVDVARGGERAEVDAQAAGFEQRRAHGDARFDWTAADNRSHRPMMPLRANSAMTTSRSPRPSCQAVG